jgi:Fis family transcriptional regulator
MNQSEAYPTRDQLDALAFQMYRGGLLYSEVVSEFKKHFVIAVLRETGGNRLRAAQKLGVHRNTISRTIAALGIDVRAIREERRLPRRVCSAIATKEAVGHP